jgi:hypothetical protein
MMRQCFAASAWRMPMSLALGFNTQCNSQIQTIQHLITLQLRER